MIKDFIDKEAEKIFRGVRSRKLPGDIQLPARRKLLMLDAATAPEDLRMLLDRSGEYPDVELILTGRNAPDFAVERAGLVSEVRCIKHYYMQGRPPKKGIEF